MNKNVPRIHLEEEVSRGWEHRDGILASFMGIGKGLGYVHTHSHSIPLAPGWDCEFESHLPLAGGWWNAAGRPSAEPGQDSFVDASGSIQRLPLPP